MILEKIVSPNELTEDYLIKNKTDQEIADKYGFSVEEVIKYKEKLGITPVDYDQISIEEQEILNGVVLCQELKGKYPLLYWLAYKLKKFNPTIKDFELKITYAGDLEQAIKDITPLGLSVWLSGQMSLCHDKTCYVCFSFPEKHFPLLQTTLKSKFGIKCTYNGTLTFDEENSNKLAKLVKYHLIPKMLYNLPLHERNHIIYLAGGIQLSPDKGVKWRRNLKQLLNKHGYYCIDPTKEENCLLLDKDWRELVNTDFLKFQKNMRIIIDNDLHFVDVANIIICLYDNFISGGTFHELGECYLKNKKVYLLNLDNKPLEEMNWWALGCCTRVVNSIEDLLTLLCP